MPIFSRRKKSKKKSCSFYRAPFDRPAIKHFSNCPFGNRELFAGNGIAKKKKKRENCWPQNLLLFEEEGIEELWHHFVERIRWKKLKLAFLAALSRLTYSWILLGKKKSCERCDDRSWRIGFFLRSSLFFFYSYRSESWEIDLRVKIVWKT